MQYVLKFNKDAVFATAEDALNNFNQGVDPEQAERSKPVGPAYGITKQSSWDQDTKILTISMIFPEGSTVETVQNYIIDLSSNVSLDNSNDWSSISFEIVS